MKRLAMPLWGIALCFYVGAQVGTPASAAAQTPSEQVPTQGWLPRPIFGAEAKVGLYRPEVSSDPKVLRLYSLVFDDTGADGKRASYWKRHPLRIGIEGDAYFFRALGLVGIYARVATWHATGASRVCSDAAGNPIACTSETVFSSQKGNDTASLYVLPLSLGLVWRTDEVARRTPIPLLFHVKAGFDYHLWWSRLGDKGARYLGHGALGATFGYHLAAGIGLDLEAFSRRRVMRRAHGAKSSIFVEYEWVRGAALAGPGRTHRIDFSDDQLINIGAAFLFH